MLRFCLCTSGLKFLFKITLYSIDSDRQKNVEKMMNCEVRKVFMKCVSLSGDTLFQFCETFEVCAPQAPAGEQNWYTDYCFSPIDPAAVRLQRSTASLIAIDGQRKLVRFALIREKALGQGYSTLGKPGK